MKGPDHREHEHSSLLLSPLSLTYLMIVDHHGAGGVPLIPGGEGFVLHVLEEVMDQHRGLGGDARHSLGRGQRTDG